MKKLSSAIGFFIGLTFIVAGAFIAHDTVIPSYRSWQAMQYWQSTSATLIELKDLSNSIEASYRYTVSYLEYSNDRVYISSAKDNLGFYQQEMVQQLQWIKDNSQLIEIWYDPDDPGNSVIDRNMRWGLFAFMLVFCFLFALIGVAVMYASITAGKRKLNAFETASLQQTTAQWKTARSITEFNDNLGLVSETTLALQPWLSNKAWRSPRMQSGTKAKMVAMWLFTLLWNGICSPLLFVFEEEVQQGNYVVLVALVFPMAGLFLIKKSWAITREWQRFGIIELEMEPFPGVIGGQVGGTILIKKVSDYSANYLVELLCIYNYESGSGEDSSRREEIRWHKNVQAKVMLSGNGLGLSFHIEVPNDLPESDMEQRGDYYLWRLIVSSKQGSINLNRSFTVPVFQMQSHSS